MAGSKLTVFILTPFMLCNYPDNRLHSVRVQDARPGPGGAELLNRISDTHDITKALANLIIDNKTGNPVSCFIYLNETIFTKLLKGRCAIIRVLLEGCFQLSHRNRSE